MNRLDFQNLAEIRLEDARILAEHGRFAAAYYLAGYAIECALKACIAKQTHEHDFPPRRTDSIYTHDLPLLLRSSGLEPEYKKTIEENPGILISWNSVIAWNESSRYSRNEEDLALGLLEAIQNPETGVLPWIKKHW